MRNASKNTRRIVACGMTLLAVSCGPAGKESGLSSTLGAPADSMTGIGRGATLTLTSDLTVPANETIVKIEWLREQEFRNSGDGLASLFVQTTTDCQFALKDASPDRRIVKSGTVITFDGSALKVPYGDSGNVQQDAVGVANPEALAHIACVSGEQVCDASLVFCEGIRQKQVPLATFIKAMAKVGSVKLADPVPISGPR